MGVKQGRPERSAWLQMASSHGGTATPARPAACAATNTVGRLGLWSSLPGRTTTTLGAATTLTGIASTSVSLSARAATEPISLAASTKRTCVVWSVLSDMRQASAWNTSTDMATCAEQAICARTSAAAAPCPYCFHDNAHVARLVQLWGILKNSGQTFKRGASPPAYRMQACPIMRGMHARHGSLGHIAWP